MRCSRTLFFLALVSACAGADSEPIEFRGGYTWGEAAEGPLEAVFVPSGSGSWKVDFEFEYLGRPQTWTGTAEGDLSAGPLEGKVDFDDPGLGYIFRGQFRDGVFEGTHAELIDGIEQPSGTLRFAR